MDIPSLAGLGLLAPQNEPIAVPLPLPRGGQGTISEPPGSEPGTPQSPPAEGASVAGPAAPPEAAPDPISVYGAAGRMVNERVVAGFSVLA